MTETHEFERSHEIFIDAAPGVVLDYVSHPNSLAEWIYASHYIQSEDRPLKLGDTFRELWHTVRRSGVELDRDGISRSALKDRRNHYTVRW